MGFLDFLIGGNIRIAAKSTAGLFAEGQRLYGSNESAYRHTYIFRNNTITRWAKRPKNLYVAELFRSGGILNCTYITIASLNTDAAPAHVYFEETFDSFNKEVANYLREYGVPEKYVSGDNRGCTAHISEFLMKQNIVPQGVWKTLVETKYESGHINSSSEVKNTINNNKKVTETGPARQTKAQKSPATTFGQISAAAESGDAVAQYNLGVMYFNGQDVAQSDVQAAAWFRKAADRGNAKAQYKLGLMCANGHGVAQDDAQAVVWYRKAADQGHAYAQYVLGTKYATGRGVAQDAAQAAVWYRKAADLGHTGAQEVLRKMGAGR